MLFQNTKVSAVLEGHKGMGPGFDFLRLGLAILIFYAHTKFVLGSPATAELFQGTKMMPEAAIDKSHALSLFAEIKARAYVLAVPMFFALSGFLVTGSAVRLGSIKRFLMFRVLRILPALVVEVCLSAVVLGIFFSNLPIMDYLSSFGFWRYFGNVLGLNWFFLPGVFSENPSQLINPNLWTLPGEFYCYLVMSVLGSGPIDLLEAAVAA